MLFELALHLHTPVYVLRETMPYDELLKWIKFFDKYPAGWAEDMRTMKLMQVMGDQRRPQEVFPTLAKLHKARPASVASSLQGSLMFQKMLSAKGGDKLEWLHDKANA